MGRSQLEPHRVLMIVWLPLLLGSIYIAQCAWFIATQSLTFDEPIHIQAGLEAWRGRFERLGDHPPLGRLLFTVPFVLGRWPAADIERLARGELPLQTRPEAWAWRARPVNVLLGLTLAALVWHAARRTCSVGAANFALALFALSPALIAHFSLATTDGIGALLIFAAALQTARWRATPSRAQAARLGVILGALLVSKFFTPPLFVLACLWVLLSGRSGGQLTEAAARRQWNWRPTASIVAIAGLTLWSVYLFHVTRVTLVDGQLAARFPGYREPIVERMATPVEGTFLVPAAEYVAGLTKQIRHNRRGHPAFLLGQVSRQGGWLSYFPTVILLKWPPLLLTLCIAGLVLAVARRIPLTALTVLVASFPTTFFVLALFARLNLGERYILSLYPFALLACAWVWEGARRHTRARVILALALVVQAADTLRYAPDYLSYFTPFVRPARSYTLLSDSNVDWGQGLIALRHYQQEHPNEKLFLAYFGKVEPAAYGIQYHALRPAERVTGTVVISATHLSGQYLAEPSAYHWVLTAPGERILNHSLHVFDVGAAKVP